MDLLKACSNELQWCLSYDVDIDCVAFLTKCILSGGHGPIPLDCCGDVDASNAIDIDDAVYLISYIFSGGPDPIYNCDPEW